MCASGGDIKSNDISKLYVDCPQDIL